MDPELNLIYFGKRYYDPALGRWISADPMGFADSMNLYQHVLNNPFSYADPDGQFIVAIPLLALTWKVVAAAAVAAFVGYELEHQLGHSHSSDLEKAFGAAFGQMAKGSLGLALNQAVDTEKKKKQNTNPFDGPIDQDVVIVDEAGNAIKVPPGNWLTGTKDGKWMQEMQPGIGPKGIPNGQRKDGGGHPPPKHADPRANAPHAHVPGVINCDGSEWLPIKS